MSLSPRLSASSAAARLGVTPQTIRNRLRAGTLTGGINARGRWEVDVTSVEASPANDRRNEGPGTLAALGREVKRLAAVVDDLKSSETPAPGHLKAVERERDRYRADAAAARSAALSLIGAAREVDGAVRQTLRILELQSEALVQLLAPGSPEDLTP